MSKDEAKITWKLFGVACIVLLLGIVACVATANVISDTGVWVIGSTFGAADIVLWVIFFKRMGWFSSRHEGGGSSVK